MIVILSRDRQLNRATCQSSVGAANIEPAINLSRPEAIFSLPSNRPVTRGLRAHLLLLRGKREEGEAKGAEIDLDDFRHARRQLGATQ
jgi:hypothetical protein